MAETIPDSIAEQVQSLDAGERVTLFELDLTPLGGGVEHFTPSLSAGEIVYFDSVPYTAIECEATGFEWSSQGAPPTPRFKLGNIGRAGSSLVLEYDDLVGGILRRIRTWKQFLDDGDDPDPAAYLPVDVYFIERLAEQGRLFVEWELSSPLDQDGVKLPARQVLRDVCTHIYRYWDAVAEEFDYTQATCPYAGSAYFTATGEATADPAADRCSKYLSGCRARFGRDPLPTRAFPGVARVRT